MDPSERIIRRGALTEQSLVDALLTERRTGRNPMQVAVGSTDLELAATRALSPHSGVLDDLRPGIPNVVLDRELPADAWELREVEAA
jgi:hypothetical protein